MDKHDVTGTIQIAGGAYSGCYAVKHGLHRVAGIRIENHITSKENAEKIKKSGYILDPLCGGKNGCSEKINSNKCKINSTGFVHISGINKDSKFYTKGWVKKYNYLSEPLRVVHRNMQHVMYEAVYRGEYLSLIKKIRQNKIQCFNAYLKAFTFLLNPKSKRFYIPGTDNYFYKEFISDTDDFALKSSKPVKVYKNRMNATLAGLKNFGLKGMKENKGRVAFGVGILSLGLYSCYNLFNKGIKNICNK